MPEESAPETSSALAENVRDHRLPSARPEVQGAPIRVGDGIISEFVANDKDSLEVAKKYRFKLQYFHLLLGSFAFAGAFAVILFNIYWHTYMSLDPEYDAYLEVSLAEYAQKYSKNAHILLSPFFSCAALMITAKYHLLMVVSRRSVVAIEMFQENGNISGLAKKFENEFYSDQYYHWFFQRVVPSLGGNEHKYYGAAMALLCFSILNLMLQGHEILLSITGALLVYLSFYTHYIRREEDAKWMAHFAFFPMMVKDYIHNWSDDARYLLCTIELSRLAAYRPCPLLKSAECSLITFLFMAACFYESMQMQLLSDTTMHLLSLLCGTFFICTMITIIEDIQDSKSHNFSIYRKCAPMFFLWCMVFACAFASLKPFKDIMLGEKMEYKIVELYGIQPAIDEL